MAIQTFEYCSLYYLNQWLSHDREYCQVLANGNEEEKLSILKSAGSFYRVARNLSREFDEKKGLVRCKPVLEILDTVNKEQFEDNAVKKIQKVKNKISGRYGDRSVLSLTTKFLWLKIKQPVLIYDSQVRSSLGLKNEDLSEYYYNWKKEFKNYKGKIASVCSKLPDLYLYTIDQEVGTKEYIGEVSSKEWFHDRVFDIYLWNKGKKV